MKTGFGWSSIAFVFGIVISTFIQNGTWIPWTMYVNLSTEDPYTTEQPARFYYRQDSLETSGWCHGEKPENRQCHFQNLCYFPEKERFIMLVSQKSAFMGFNSSDAPYLADVTGLPDMNTLPMSFDTVSTEDFMQADDSPSVVVVPDSPIMVIARYLPQNIFHVIHDDIIPLFFTYYELCNGNVSACEELLTIAIFDGHGTTKFRFLYEYLSVKQTYATHTDVNNFTKSLMNNTIYCMHETHIGLTKNYSWYDFVHGPHEGPRPTKLDNLKIEMFTNWLESKTCESHPELCHDDKCSEDHESGFLIINRHFDRKILNTKDVYDMAERHSKRLWPNLKTPVRMVAMETHSFHQIFCAFRRTKVVIGMHGAMQIMTMFLRPHSAVIEMFPYAIVPEHLSCFQTLSNLPSRKIIHKVWRNYLKNNTVGHADAAEDRGGIDHLPEVEREYILNLKDCPRVKCCGNATAKYLLNQDTIIDVPTLEPLVVAALEEMGSITAANKSLPLSPRLSKCNMLACNRTDGEIIVTFNPPWNARYLREYTNNKTLLYKVGMKKAGTRDIVFIVNTNNTKVRWLDAIPSDPVTVMVQTLLDGEEEGEWLEHNCMQLLPDQLQESDYDPDPLLFGTLLEA